jgi:hypothetical protein
MSLSSSSTLLLLYISCETVRANYAYNAFHTFPQISASLIALLSETVKLSVEIEFLMRSKNIPLSALQKYLGGQSGDHDFQKRSRTLSPPRSTS